MRKKIHHEGHEEHEGEEGEEGRDSIATVRDFVR
jgi:hypothetical protein